MAVPPAGREREAGILRAKSGREVVEVAGARPAPAVDRLVRIPDRHHRMASEQIREQPGLHHRGVLVFIEQNDAVLVSLRLCDPGLLANDREGKRDLIRILDEPALVFRCLELGRKIDEHLERSDRFGELGDLLV